MTNPLLNHRFVLRILPIILLLILLSATLSHADSDGIISGNVTDAADTALPSARVYLYSSTMRSLKGTSTDISGNYTFTALASGTYYIRFSKTGIVPVWYNGASTHLSATPITVTAPNTVAGINGKLGVGGSISGKVTNAADAVLPNVNISLYDSTGYPIISTSTDPAGNYTFGGLASGNYKVQFSNIGMIPVWYNGETTQQTATLISVNASDAVTGINAKLGVGGSINGKVTDSADVALGSVFVSIYGLTGDSLTYTSTDAAGNYTISGLASGTYKVQFSKIGMIPVWYNGATTQQTATPIFVTAPDVVTGINVRLGVGSSISGKVTDSSDVALASAYVSINDLTGNSIAYTATDTAGNYTISGLASGTYYIQFSKNGMLSIWYNGASSLQSATPITVTAPNAVTGINMKLSTGGSISGKVTDSSDAALPSVSVYLINTTGMISTTTGTTGCFSGGTGTNGGLYGSSNYTTTDASGNYTFSGLASGTYCVQFNKSGMVPVWYDGATNQLEGTPITVTVPSAVTGINGKLGAGSSISGKVTDVDDVALALVLVSVYDSTGNYIADTFTDAAGNYTISGFVSGTYKIQFSRSGMIPNWYNGATTQQTATPITVTAPNALTGINAKLIIGGSIIGKVTDASDADLSAVSVSLYDSTGNYIADTFTDAAGNYTFSDLASGTYYIQFYKYSMLSIWYNGATTKQSSTPISVTAPNAVTGINAKFNTGGSISGKVTDASDAALPWVSVYLYDSTGNFINTFTDSVGNYNVSGLASGTYYIQFYKYGMLSIWYNGASTQQTANPITVTAPNAVTGINAKLSTGGSISGKVTDASDAALPWVSVYLYDSTGNFTTLTSTDPAGNYTISGLASGTYNVQFSTNGMVPVWYIGSTTRQNATPIVVTAPNAVTGINAKLGVGSSISGKVTDVSDAALPSVSVSLFDSAGYFITSTITDVAGTYTLRGLSNGSYYLLFENNVMAPAWYNGSTTRQNATAIVVTTPNDITGINVRLGVGSSISGKVTDSSDAALSSVSVFLFDSSGYYIINTSTDASGNYTISGLSSGTYFIQFYKNGMMPLWYKGAITLQSATPITLIYPNAVTGINGKLNASGSITGKVTDVDNSALQSVLVSLYDTTGYLINNTSTDSTGNYTFSGLATGIYYIHFNKIGMLSAWYNGSATQQTATPIPVIAPNAVTSINGKLLSGGTISGKVTGADDLPLPSTWVFLFDSTWNNIASASTDVSGDYTFSNLASGTYYIQFNKSGMIPVWYNGVTTQLTATPVTVLAPNVISGVNVKIATPLFITINCIVNGTGGGTITSSPVGISCMSGKTDGCSAVFDSTLWATLSVTPNVTSTFSGWSGDCAGLESCILNTPTDHNVTATFIAAPKAKIGDNSYISLDAAYSAVDTVAEIHTLDTELVEDLTIEDKIITLKGGYKADYSDLSGTPTILNGVVKIRSGKLSVSNIVIK